MAQQVEHLLYKPGDLSSIPRAQVRRKERADFNKVVLWFLCACCGVHMHTHTVMIIYFKGTLLLNIIKY